MGLKGRIPSGAYGEKYNKKLKYEKKLKRGLDKVSANKDLQVVVAGHICFDVMSAFKKTEKIKNEAKQVWLGKKDRGTYSWM